MNSDEEFGRHLPALLTEVPMPPSTVDVGQAIRTGKRRRQSRYTASAIAVLAIIIAVPIALQSQRPQAPPLAVPSSSPSIVVADPKTCSVEETVAGFLSVSVDPGGRHFAGVVEDKTDVEMTRHKPVMWRDGRIEMIPVPADNSGYVDAVNASGVAVGRLVDKDGISTFAYHEGRFQVLPGSKDAKPLAINDAGVIVGARHAGRVWIPLRWQSLSSEPETLSLPEGYASGVAVAVTDDGVVFGHVSPDESGRQGIAYRWTADGKGSPLPVPGASGYPIRTGHGDWVGGGIAPKDENSKQGAFVFNTRTGDLRQLSSFFLEGETPVTSKGWFIGRELASGKDELVLTDGSARIELPLPRDVGRVILDSVSADGRVVTGHRVDILGTGVIWRCE